MKKEQRKFIAYTLASLFFFTGCTNSLFSARPTVENPPVPKPYGGELTEPAATYGGYDDPAEE
ncbi:MAG: hypothetical protein LBT34_02230, partial [Clostridiales Family XIII bacterium]|nr:hypothetical protein [Clostridiales Family XIII bacterium]